MEAYSTKLRELVLGAYEVGKKTKEIAGMFKVSVSWARGVKRRCRESGLRGVIQPGCHHNRLRRILQSLWL